MDLASSMQDAERALISDLNAVRSAIDNTTGKGTATEEIVDKRLIAPYLPPRFAAQKGAIITRHSSNQSPAFDRVVYDRSVAAPLFMNPAHAIFPLEAAAGVIEITMFLDAKKLRTDMERMRDIRSHTKRRYLVPLADGGPLGAYKTDAEIMGVRCHAIGLPANDTWPVDDIAQLFLQIQHDEGQLVHGLYVLGIGYFETMPQTDSLKAWTGSDRMFRFTDSLRTAFDRWTQLPPNVSADLSDYVTGTPRPIKRKS